MYRRRNVLSCAYRSRYVLKMNLQLYNRKIVIHLAGFYQAFKIFQARFPLLNIDIFPTTRKNLNDSQPTQTDLIQSVCLKHLIHVIVSRWTPINDLLLPDISWEFNETLDPRIKLFCEPLDHSSSNWNCWVSAKHLVFMDHSIGRKKATTHSGLWMTTASKSCRYVCSARITSEARNVSSKAEHRARLLLAATHSSSPKQNSWVSAARYL